MVRRTTFLLCLLLLPGLSLGQTAKDRVGFTQLASEIGASLEDGTGIRVGIVEANVEAAYLPNVASAEFAGKTISDGSGSNVGSTSHATTVARHLFGNSTSMSAGVTNVTGYNASHWLDVVLGYDTGIEDGLQRAAPQVQDFAVMNHSYIGNSTAATEYSRRLDLVAERDNVTMVVATNNGFSDASLPQLLSQTYNTITVGRSDGSHWHGDTTINGSGRLKPDIVAPQGATSFATPMVGSAATLLREQAASLPSANANRNEVTKAVLMAGATKGEFPGWSNSETSPLDSQFGAGELNIYNSYHILAGGEFDGSTTEAGTPDVAALGWDYETLLTEGTSQFYNIDVTSEVDASLILTWNAEVSESGIGEFDYDTLALADLNLQLYDSTGGFLGTLLDQSISTVDNVEHIYYQGLGIGSYTIAVRGVSGNSDYALAWRFTAVPEPSALAALAFVGVACTLRRRKYAI